LLGEAIPHRSVGRGRESDELPVRTRIGRAGGGALLDEQLRQTCVLAERGEAKKTIEERDGTRKLCREGLESKRVEVGRPEPLNVVRIEPLRRGKQRRDELVREPIGRGVERQPRRERVPRRMAGL